MKQESIDHPRHKSYPRDPQIRAYYHSDDVNEPQASDTVADAGYHGSIQDWQNPSRFRRSDAR
jgi:hypothetical protein